MSKPGAGSSNSLTGGAITIAPRRIQDAVADADTDWIQPDFINIDLNGTYNAVFYRNTWIGIGNRYSVLLIVSAHSLIRETSQEPKSSAE